MKLTPAAASTYLLSRLCSITGREIAPDITTVSHLFFSEAISSDHAGLLSAVDKIAAILGSVAGQVSAKDLYDAVDTYQSLEDGGTPFCPPIKETLRSLFESEDHSG